MEQRYETAAFSVAILAMTAGAMAIEPWPGVLRVQPQVVRFGDLDLTRPAHVATLHERLRRAADKACLLDGGGTFSIRLRDTCRDRLIEQGLAALPVAVSVPCSRTGCSRPGSS